MAITWRNINAPDFRGVNDIFESAQNSINQAGNNVNNALGVIDKSQKRNIDERSNAFIDQLQNQFSTPEELRQAQESGALDQLRSEAGKLNRNITGNKAIDSLVSNLQQRTVQDNNYNQSQLVKNTRGNREEFSTLLFDKEFDEARNFLETNTFADKGQRLSDLDAAIRAKQNKDEKDKERERTIRLQNRQESRDILRNQREEDLYQQQLANNKKDQYLNNLERELFLARGNMKEDFSYQVQQLESAAKANQIDTLKLDDANYLSSLNDDQIRLVEELKQNINSIEAPINDTEFKRNYIDRLVSEGLTPREAENRARSLDEISLATRDLSASEIEKNKQEKAQWQNEYKDNPFVQQKLAGVTQEQVASNVLNSMDKDFIDELGGTGSGDYQNVLRTLNKIAAEGFEYELAGVVVPVTESMLKNALLRTNNTGGGILNLDRNMKDTLKEVIKEGPWLEALQDYKMYELGLSEIDSRIKAREYSPANVIKMFNSADTNKARELSLKREAEEARELLEQELRQRERVLKEEKNQFNNSLNSMSDIEKRRQEMTDRLNQ